MAVGRTSCDVHRSWQEAETTCHLASREAFPVGEVMASISNTNCFVLALSKTGLDGMRGKMTLGQATNPARPPFTTLSRLQVGRDLTVALLLAERLGVSYILT